MQEGEAISPIIAERENDADSTTGNEIVENLPQEAIIGVNCGCSKVENEDESAGFNVNIASYKIGQMQEQQRNGVTPLVSTPFVAAYTIEISRKAALASNWIPII